VLPAEIPRELNRYDGNGNLISRGGATVTWSSYNLPTYIADPNGYSAQFSYAPDRSRWRQVSSYAGATETTIYVGGLLEKMTNAAATHWKHLIPTPSGQVQVIRRSNGTTDTFYVTTDHLGSADAVLNAAGAVLMRGSFNVHGARRAANWQGAPSTTEWQSIAATTRRGYTGHEQIDNVMLVHMNGRVFDPVIGRFLSADPYVDGPETTQGWNRYAYVLGRALTATDPSGFHPEGRAGRLAEVYAEIARDAATMNWLMQWGSSYSDFQGLDGSRMAPMQRFTGRQWFEFNHMQGFTSPRSGRWNDFPVTGGRSVRDDGTEEVFVQSRQSIYISDPLRFPLFSPRAIGPTPNGATQTQNAGTCRNTDGNAVQRFVSDTASTILGMADGASVGLYGELTDSLGLGPIDHNLAYNAGLYGMAAVSTGRLMYAGASSAIQYIPGISAANAIATRNSLKGVFSALGADHPRAYSVGEMMAKYGSEAAVVSAASRTNATFNTVAAALAYSSVSQTGVSNCP
jgi:RHS repeat-associated protein